jgi:hypothetical protein
LLLSYPSGLSCVTHTVLTHRNEVWCAAANSLTLWQFLPLQQKWEEFVEVHSFFPPDTITNFRVTSMYYSSELDVIWIAVSHFLLRFHLSEKTGTVLNIRQKGKSQIDKSDGKGEKTNVDNSADIGDTFTAIQNVFFLPHCRLLWLVPPTYSPFIRTISSEDLSPEIPSMRDVPLPPDVGRVTVVMSTNRMTIFSGHWDGTIVEWIYQDADLLPRSRILKPHKHMSRPIASIVMVWDTCLWSADSDGVLCVWK